MENNTTTLDKAIKISVIAGALIVALSIAYYFIYEPIQKKTETKKCNKYAESLFNDEGKGLKGWDNIQRYDYYDEFKLEYDRCLREKG